MGVMVMPATYLPHCAHRCQPPLSPPGSSHILTPKRFLDDVQTLNQLDPEEA